MWTNCLRFYDCHSQAKHLLSVLLLFFWFLNKRFGREKEEEGEGGKGREKVESPKRIIPRARGLEMCRTPDRILHKCYRRERKRGERVSTSTIHCSRMHDTIYHGASCLHSFNFPYAQRSRTEREKYLHLRVSERESETESHQYQEIPILIYKMT